MEQFPQNMEQNIEYCTCNVLLQFLFPDFAITNDNATAAVQFSFPPQHRSNMLWAANSLLVRLLYYHSFLCRIYAISRARTAKLNF